jgi:hypothetical protein
MYRLQNGFLINSTYNSKYAWLEADGYSFEIYTVAFIYEDTGDLIIQKVVHLDVGEPLDSRLDSQLKPDKYLTFSPNLSLSGINRCDSLNEALSEPMIHEMWNADKEEVFGDPSWTYPEDGRDTDRNYLGKHTLSRNIYGQWLLKED